MQFQAFRVEKNDSGVEHQIIERSTDDLPTGELLIQVAFSSVNYKDAMSAKGMPGVTRNYPHTPGIDASGTVVESSHADFKEGDEVIVTGFDLGMNTDGGFAEYIRVPAGWAVPLPAGLNLRDAMTLGTAGLTAGLCIEKLLQMNAAPTDGPVVVTGASGGVGSVAVALLAHLGFDIVASSGKSEKREYLATLGAKTLIERSDLEGENKRPLLTEDFAHGVDTVGGDILSNLIKRLRYGGSVSICGLVASPAFATTVLPFILRGVNVLGIDSVELPLVHKARIWNHFATDWQLANLDVMAVEVGLGDVSSTVDQILAGQVTGRTLVAL